MHLRETRIWGVSMGSFALRLGGECDAKKSSVRYFSECTPLSPVLKSPVFPHIPVVAKFLPGTPGAYTLEGKGKTFDSTFSPVSPSTWEMEGGGNCIWQRRWAHWEGAPKNPSPILAGRKPQPVLAWACPSLGTHVPPCFDQRGVPGDGVLLSSSRCLCKSMGKKLSLLCPRSPLGFQPSAHQP